MIENTLLKLLGKLDARREPWVSGVFPSPAVPVELILNCPATTFLTFCPISSFPKIALWAPASFSFNKAVLLASFATVLDTLTTNALTFEEMVWVSGAGGARPLVKLVKIPLGLSSLTGINTLLLSLLGNPRLLLPNPRVLVDKLPTTEPTAPTPPALVVEGGTVAGED